MDSQSNGRPGLPTSGAAPKSHEAQQEKTSLNDSAAIAASASVWQEANFKPEHRDEWLNSFVAQKTIERNVRSLEGEEALEALLGDRLATLPGHAQQYATKPVASLLERYTHVAEGGWWVSGLDPLNDWKPMAWGQFKPDQPRPNPDKPGKSVKYETPPGVEARAIFLDPGDPNYWPSVLADPSKPIVLCEGAKKAGCTITAGFAAIALPGIWMAFRTDKETVERQLIPELELFAHVDRPIIFEFDQDTNPKTREAVKAAINASATLLFSRGCDVRIAAWDPKEGKGLDDVAAAHGLGRVKEILKAASPWTPRPHFLIDQRRGLIYIDYESDKKDPNARPVEKRTYIGNYLAAIAHVNSPDGKEAALLLEFVSQRRGIQRAVIPRRLIDGDSAKLKGELGARGYRFMRKQSNLLLDYIHDVLGQDLDASKVLSDATGWSNGSFVLPTQTIGDRDLHWRDVEPPANHTIEAIGTLEGWQQTIGEMAAGNSRLILSIGAALAAPLLEPLEIESGAFHIQGATSTGKSTTLKVAASVSGSVRLQTWNTTANGLEAVAEAHNDLPLLLDEIGECAPKDAAAIAYMVANGKGKQRMRKDTAARDSKTWRTLVLSSGELTLLEVLRQGGFSAKGGQEARFPSIPAVPRGGQHGLFETIHGSLSARDFADQLVSVSRKNRGTPLLAFLEHLVPVTSDPEWRDHQSARLREITRELCQGIPDNDGAVGRVAKRFALVQLALELAQAWGVTVFQPDQPAWAIATCFTDWLEARGGAGSLEIKQACDRIEELFVSNQHSDRIHRIGDENAIVRNLLAHHKPDPFGAEEEFWVEPATFRAELAKGVDSQALIAELQRRGWLAGPDHEGKNQLRRSIGGKRTRVYVFLPFWRSEAVPGVQCPQPSVLSPVSSVPEPVSSVPSLVSQPGVPCQNSLPVKVSATHTLGTQQKLGTQPGVPTQTYTGQGFEGSRDTGTPGHREIESIEGLTSGSPVEIWATELGEWLNGHTLGKEYRGMRLSPIDRTLRSAYYVLDSQGRSHLVTADCIRPCQPAAIPLPEGHEEW